MANSRRLARVQEEEEEETDLIDLVMPNDFND